MDIEEIEDSLKRYIDMSPESYNFYKNLPRPEYMRRTFILLSIQLMLSSVIMCPLSLIDPIREVVTSDYRISYSSLGIFIAANLVIIFCSQLMQVHPFSYVLLFIITVITAFWSGVICARYKVAWVVCSIFFVLGLSIVLSSVALRVPYDFTKLIGLLLVLALFAALGCTIFFFWPNPQFKWVILIASIHLTAIYFVVDLQMIFGIGTQILAVEDFVLSSSIVFIDVVYLLVYSVMIIGEWFQYAA